MKQGRIITKYILLLSLICMLAGIAAAEPVFSSGSYISTSASASVQGTINETVSFTRTTLGGDIEKTEYTNSYITADQDSLSWRSHLSVSADQESAQLDYTRTGDLPRISWSSILDGSSRSDASPRFSRAR